jgi:hypothetical protein
MKFVPTAVSQKMARQVLKGRKASPTILFAVGVGGMVGSTVLACRSTLKLSDTLEQAQNDLYAAKRIEGENYDENDRRKDIALIYTRGAVSVAKLYAPSLLLGAASVGCLTKSHNILSQRNAALTAAYVAIDEAFTKYRERVVEKYGDEQDREFRYEMEDVEVITDDGKISIERRVGPDGASMYARFFDEYSSAWSKDPEYNLVFLRAQQSYLNDLLIRRGHVFLNEVYDCLGIERTTAGSVVGWVISHDGDNYIDFGLYDNRNNDRVRDFINGREGSVLLDFNVDGIIYDKIDVKKEKLQWQS